MIEIGHMITITGIFILLLIIIVVGVIIIFFSTKQPLLRTKSEQPIQENKTRKILHTLQKKLFDDTHQQTSYNNIKTDTNRNRIYGHRYTSTLRSARLHTHVPRSISRCYNRIGK